MSAEYLSFVQAGRRLAFRRADITGAREAADDDEDQRVALIVNGSPTRVDDTYDTVMDRLNE